jgi:hypothetical protein
MGVPLAAHPWKASLAKAYNASAEGALVKAPQPEWSIPENLLELVHGDEGGIWEDDSWDPILLTVMTGTVYKGRDIPLAWQIEFEPVGPRFEAANKKLMTLGLDPDGYGWATLIKNVAEKYHPDVAKELQFDEELSRVCGVGRVRGRMSSAHPDDVDAHQCRVAVKRVYLWHAKQLTVWREVLLKSAETARDVAYWPTAAQIDVRSNVCSWGVKRTRSAQCEFFCL